VYSGQIYADGDTASCNTIRNELVAAVDVASDRPAGGERHGVLTLQLNGRRENRARALSNSLSLNRTVLQRLDL
jgi:hypothetical protein